MDDAAARPVWLLDVDGVLNAPRPGWHARPAGGTAYAGGYGYAMRFAPPLMARLRTLHRSGAVEVRWSTTWVDDIEQIHALMRLPVWPVAFRLARTDLDPVTAKYRAAVDVVETEGRPLVWTDDEVVPPPESRAARRLHEAGPPVLLVRPDPARGLQPHHLDRIESFLRDAQR